MPDTQVGHDTDMGGQFEGAGELALLEEAHPADTQPFGAGRQPEILHRAHAGVRSDLRLGVPPENMPATAGRVAGHHNVHRGLEYRLDLQVAERKRP